MAHATGMTCAFLRDTSSHPFSLSHTLAHSTSHHWPPSLHCPSVPPSLHLPLCPVFPCALCSLFTRPIHSSHPYTRTHPTPTPIPILPPQSGPPPGHRDRGQPPDRPERSDPGRAQELGRSPSQCCAPPPAICPGPADPNRRPDPVTSVSVRIATCTAAPPTVLLSLTAFCPLSLCIRCDWRPPVKKHRKC